MSPKTDKEIALFGIDVERFGTDLEGKPVVDANGNQIGQVDRFEEEVGFIRPNEGVWERLSEKYETDKLSIHAEDLGFNGEEVRTSWSIDELA